MTTLDKYVYTVLFFSSVCFVLDFLLNLLGYRKARRYYPKR